MGKDVGGKSPQLCCLVLIDVCMDGWMDEWDTRICLDMELSTEGW